MEDIIKRFDAMINNPRMLPPESVDLCCDALSHLRTLSSKCERYRAALDGIAKYCESRTVNSDYIHVMNTAQQALRSE